MQTPVTPAVAVTMPNPEMNFLGQKYRLGSYNQKVNPQWEFVPVGESIDDWKTLLTVIDRPEAHSREDLDRLSEGILNAYKSHDGQVLMAKTMQLPSGDPYNYVVVAFEQPGQRRFELNFVKMALGRAGAEILIYGVRVSDPQDYKAKAKEFLNERSGEIGKALNTLAVPDVSRMPRREF